MHLRLICRAGRSSGWLKRQAILYPANEPPVSAPHPRLQQKSGDLIIRIRLSPDALRCKLPHSAPFTQLASVGGAMPICLTRGAMCRLVHCREDESGKQREAVRLGRARWHLLLVFSSVDNSVVAVDGTVILLTAAESRLESGVSRPEAAEAGRLEGLEAQGEHGRARQLYIGEHISRDRRERPENYSGLCPLPAGSA